MFKKALILRADAKNTKKMTDQAPLTEGHLLPEWSLLPIFNEPVPALADFAGRPLLILFFYNDCPACKGRAFPYANQIVLKYPEIQVIGIHTRFAGPEFDNEVLRSLKDEFHLRFPYYRDEEPAKTAWRYDAGGTPHWILVNAAGKVVKSLFGSDPNRGLYWMDLALEEMMGR